MNYKIIAQIVLFFSSLGLGSIIVSKISQLNTLSESVSFEGVNVKGTLTKRFKNSTVLRKLSPNVFLQKFLTRVRNLSKKTDKKTSLLLDKLKEDTQKKRITQDRDYWDKVKGTSNDDI